VSGLGEDMSNILNITNGDFAVEIMKKAGIPGKLLPWRDVLHMGPVPEDLSLGELSEVRAKFISGEGWGDPKAITQSFIERDNTLKSYENYEKVILWFEHDLYDQLQILQILDWLHGHRSSRTQLSIICIDQYLGRLTPEEMASLFKYEVPITDAQLNLANRAWAAFRSNTPEKWSALLKEDTSALPFLKGAILRMLEEYPSQRNGLSRTEQQALTIISEGENRPGRVFGHNQEREERIFMGDAGFWTILHGFLESEPPLLKLPEGKELTLPTSPDQELTITPAGTEVLSGKRNWLEINPPHRWMGGVHLSQDNVWCWDSVAGKAIKIG
jgi:hypothetical protein